MLKLGRYPPQKSSRATLRAVCKSGTGTSGRSVGGPWDLGTRDEGLQDIKYGTRGRVGRGRWDVKYRDARSTSPKSPHTRPDVPVPLSPSHFYSQPWLRLTKQLK